jgi:hypothetical protein
MCIESSYPGFLMDHYHDIGWILGGVDRNLPHSTEEGYTDMALSHS